MSKKKQEPDPQEAINKQIESDLSTICHRVINRKGWKQFDDIETKVMPDEQMPGAFIRLDTRQITIFAAPDTYDAIDSLISNEKLKYTRQEVFEKMIEMVVIHEYGHHCYCPRTKEGFEAICEAAYDAVAPYETNKEWILSISKCNTVPALIANLDEERLHIPLVDLISWRKTALSVKHLVAAHNNGLTYTTSLQEFLVGGYTEGSKWYFDIDNCSGPYFMDLEWLLPEESNINSAVTDTTFTQTDILDF